jgi:hypothetical protein
MLANKGYVHGGLLSPGYGSMGILSDEENSSNSSTNQSLELACCSPTDKNLQHHFAEIKGPVDEVLGVQISCVWL